MLCPVGRSYNPDHATCRTCRIDCKKPVKVRKAFNSGPAGPGRWATTLDLTSPNEWTNKNHGKVIYNRVKREWRKSILRADLHLGVAHGMRRVEIVRFIYSLRHRMDKDNLYGSVKPLLDCLKAVRVILDDGPDFISLDVRQEIGAPRVEITVINIAKETP
jgi:Holliday junction resolvase RusA-like endonuclease